MFTVKMKRWINFILICCVLFSGICFEIGRADCLALRAVNEEVQTLESVEALSANRDFCTNEMIEACTSGSVSLQAVRVNGRRISGRTCQAQEIYLTPTDLFANISEIPMEQVIVENACNSTVIVSYIHNKDGKKA